MVLWLLPLILGYGENPLPEMTSLAEAHGIRLFSLPTVGRDVDAFSFMFDGVPYVAVDTSKTAERVRFDIAHEIGHLMMHEMVSEDVAIPSLSTSDLATFDHEGFSYPNPSLRKAITEKRDGYAF